MVQRANACHFVLAAAPPAPAELLTIGSCRRPSRANDIGPTPAGVGRCRYHLLEVDSYQYVEDGFAAREQAPVVALPDGGADYIH
jgi:hypothetical protein